ncbi:MAG: lipase family protein [Candidatus Omnitrophota bacterium]
MLSKDELTNACLLADLSELAYKPQSEIQAVLPSLNLSFEDFFNDPTSGTQGFLAKNERAAFLLFRGTERDKPEDVIVDLLAWPASHPSGKVHAGFQFAFNSVKSAVEKHFQKLQDFPVPVYVGGHSLGGSLAVLAAAYMIDKNIPVAGLYTFGQPRVGNAKFEKHYAPLIVENYYRFTNAQDLFPHVPPCFMGYRHLGESSYHFSDDGKLGKSSSRWEWIVESAFILFAAYRKSEKIRDFVHKLIRRNPKESEALKLSAKEASKDFFKIFKCNIVDDHDMKTCYIKNLKKNQ